MFICEQISKGDNTEIMVLMDSHPDAAVQEDSYENNMKNQIEDSQHPTHCLWKILQLQKPFVFLFVFWDPYIVNCPLSCWLQCMHWLFCQRWAITR